jgi:murein DD-endopeptidase MepM/ murein hydrolase activator NlpD
MRRSLAVLVVLLLLPACAGNISASSTPEFKSPVPYLSDITPSPTATLIPTLRVAILPTPTTYTYTVALGDTFSSIASHTGVALQALMDANPGISPTALKVGMVLVIPTGNSVPGLATPTPARLPVSQARCWPELTGGMWCFALVHNEYNETLEDISAQFTLLDADGQQLANQVAFGYLDILPSGAAFPLALHFTTSLPAGGGVRVQVLTAIRLLPGDVRYLPVSLNNTLIGLDASGRLADVSGLVVLSGSDSANTLWILATAFDSSGEVVGVRRWESPSKVEPSSPVSFDFQVSSVGPPIDHVNFLAEAKP